MGTHACSHVLLCCIRQIIAYVCQDGTVTLVIATAARPVVRKHDRTISNGSRNGGSNNDDNGNGGKSIARKVRFELHGLGSLATRTGTRTAATTVSSLNVWRTTAGVDGDGIRSVAGPSGADNGRFDDEMGWSDDDEARKAFASNTNTSTYFVAVLGVNILDTCM